MDDTPTGWDTIQIEYVNKLIDKLGIQHFFETGTHLGQTSKYFYDKKLKVHTAEINSTYFERSMKRFKGLDIELVKADSKEYVKWFANRQLDNVLYYLDAHWEGPCPLEEELYHLMKLPKFLILVHDTPVPGRVEFHVEDDVDVIWTRVLHDDKFPIGTTMITPNYVIDNTYAPFFLVGYCIISRGYPLVMDDRFTFMEKTVKQ